MDTKVAVPMEPPEKYIVSIQSTRHDQALEAFGDFPHRGVQRLLPWPRELTDSNQLQLTISQMSLELVCIADRTHQLVLSRRLNRVETALGRDIDSLLAFVPSHRERSQNSAKYRVEIEKKVEDE
jgi:hypothetical protein